MYSFLRRKIYMHMKPHTRKLYLDLMLTLLYFTKLNRYYNYQNLLIFFPIDSKFMTVILKEKHLFNLLM